MDDYDALVKIVVIGDKSVGKSSLVLQFCDNTFPTQYIATIGVDFRIRTLDIDGKRTKMQVWDTAGEERFKAITKSYYRGAHGAIIVYDCTDRHTFDSVPRWLEEVQPAALPGAPVLLVGNKSDAGAKGSVVDAQAAQGLAQQLGMMWYEASAKTGHNVTELFTALARKCMEQGTLRRPAALKPTIGPATPLAAPDQQACSC